MSINLMFGSSAKAAAVSQIMAEGIQTRSMQTVISKYGSTLTPTDKSALLSLTDQELTALQSINTKLAPLGINAMY